MHFRLSYSSAFVAKEATLTWYLREIATKNAGVSKTVLCNTSVLANGGNNTYICYNFATVDPVTLVTSASLPNAGGSSAGVASGNIDPLYNQVRFRIFQRKRTVIPPDFPPYNSASHAQRFPCTVVHWLHHHRECRLQVPAQH